mgnify:CR=1 FL=1
MTNYIPFVINRRSIGSWQIDKSAACLLCLIVVLSPFQCIAETENEIRIRLEYSRERDQQEALRRKREYEATWKRYGDHLEVMITSWKKQQAGIWVANGKAADLESQRIKRALNLLESGIISQNEFCQMARCSSPVLISVDCGSLRVRKRFSQQAWRRWERPSLGSPEEQLLIDRCAS